MREYFLAMLFAAAAFRLRSCGMRYSYVFADDVYAAIYFLDIFLFYFLCAAFFSSLYFHFLCHMLYCSSACFCRVSATSECSSCSRAIALFLASAVFFCAIVDVIYAADMMSLF